MTDVQENVLVEEPVKTLTDNTNNGVANLSQAKSPESKSVDPKNLSEEERLKLRAKKFGAQTDQSKKDVRAARFGTPATATSGSGAATTDPGLLEKRAQRFGTSAPSTPVAGPNKELLEKRAKRFGSDASTESNGSNKPSDELLAKRKERFGETASTEDDAKKKLRQQRFQSTA